MTNQSFRNNLEFPSQVSTALAKLCTGAWWYKYCVVSRTKLLKIAKWKFEAKLKKIAFSFFLGLVKGLCGRYPLVSTSSLTASSLKPYRIDIFPDLSAASCLHPLCFYQEFLSFPCSADSYSSLEPPKSLHPRIPHPWHWGLVA